MHLALAYRLEQHTECFLGVMTSFGLNMANDVCAAKYPLETKCQIGNRSNQSPASLTQDC